MQDHAVERHFEIALADALHRENAAKPEVTRA
jgi:hypothetical protein